MGSYGVYYGTSRASTLLGIDRSEINYWTTKLQDPNFHSHPWGGQRSKQIFAPEELQEVYLGFLNFIRDHPNS